jgi:thiol-disulfide isomerase/thioredoxin
MVPALFLYAALVDNVRGLIAQHNFDAAERYARAAESHGVTPEVAEAFSWIARGELDARRYDKADAYAAETRKLSDALLRGRHLDAEPVLPIALGASIEVHAQSLAATGQRSEAVVFLRDQAKLFAGTSIVERIRKNLNLLNMEGKPAPELDTGDWLGAKPPKLASLHGKPVLLFFWAHWCVDCKAEVQIVADVQKRYGPKGLVVIGPTKFYGYVGSGQEAGPMVEKPYIDRVQQQFYAAISPMPAPLSDTNFQAYGASTVPTLVLIDSSGIVRMYHPGAMPEAELSARIQAILKK